MKENYAPQLRKLLNSGVGLDEALGQLRESGSSPIKTIKAIYDVRGVSLGEAKLIFSECPAWQDVVQAAEQLHDDMLEALEGECGSQNK